VTFLVKGTGEVHLTGYLEERELETGSSEEESAEEQTKKVVKPV